MNRTGTTALALLLLLAPLAAAQDVVTGFDPKVDGLPFENLGDYASPDGNCWGMSMLAIDAFLRRRAGEAPAPSGPIARAPQEGHAELQLTASFVQAHAEEVDERQKDRENPRHGLRDPGPLNEALARIARTGEPEVLAIADGSSAHALVVHGYRGGALQLYDPNYPGETIAWPFDPRRGLGRHPKARDDSMYRDVNRVSSTPFRQFESSRDLAWIRAACAAGEGVCTGRFPTIAATTRRDGDRVVVEGTVEGGLGVNATGETTHRPRRVWVASDGRPVGGALVGRGGRFRVVLPAGAVRDARSLRLIAATKGGAFAGFRDVPAPAETPGAAGTLEGLFGR